MDECRTTTKHVILKLQNIGNKHSKIFQKEKNELTVKGSRIRLALDFSIVALENEENGAILSKFSREMT